MQKFNYHTHTRRCGHADNNMTDEDFVKLFIKKGFTKIAFTDHCPQKERIDFRKNMRMEYKEKDDYLNSIKNENNYEEIKQALIPQDYNLIVTPKEIDDLIENMKDIVARGINYAVN